VWRRDPRSSLAVAASLHAQRAVLWDHHGYRVGCYA